MDAASSTSLVQEPPIVFAIDDDPEVRKSLVQLLTTADLAVQTFESAEEFLSAGPLESHGCILLDLQMPGMTGIELLRKLVQVKSQLPVLMVTAHAQVPIAVEALKLGAFDFIEKPYQAQKLIQKVQSALAQNAARHQVETAKKAVAIRFDMLSESERSVARLIVEGNPFEEIAAELEIDESSVESHHSQILSKLNVKSNVELVRAIVANS